jgi:hypothetical protein
MEGGPGKKEQGSYGQALSRHCFRAHQQRHDFIVVAPGHQDVEFLPCNGYLAHPFAKLTTSPTQPIYVLGTELD